jgi:hypothetical protein
MQRAVNTTIEEEVFSIWFACIHFWAKDVFSMDPPQDYISSTAQNQIKKERENKNENGKSPRQSRKKGSAED